jgi:hypothetical protein
MPAFAQSPKDRNAERVYHGMEVNKARAMASNPNRNTQKNSDFRERLGDKDIEMGDFRVDDLRKIASEFDVSGSHDMHKEELVKAINKARRK